jgi:hypothetical protein
MDHLCNGCGKPLSRKTNRGPFPLKCPSCHVASLSGKWLSASCDTCGGHIGTQPRRGPIPKRCLSCRQNAENQRYSKNCRQCGNQFFTPHKHQQSCSPECGHLASRKRVHVSCRQCGSKIEVFHCESESRKFCSPKCRTESRRIWRTCAGCEKLFNRVLSGGLPHQDKGKYCSRSCYLDHRWGKDRPRRPTSKCGLDAACRHSLATSLRKRCKHYGVPFDPSCTREAVCERDGWVCQQCGVKCHKGRHRFNKRTRKISKRNAEHDHIVPLSWRKPSKGNTLDNSQCLCRACNGRKKNCGGGQMRLNLLEC